MKNILVFPALLFFVVNGLLAQKKHSQNEFQFTSQDSLRGSITKERSWWDVQKYDLKLRINPVDSTIIGSNDIRYLVLNHHTTLQIDLQEPLRITKVLQDGKSLPFKRNGSVFLIDLQKKQLKGTTNTLTVCYEGKPKSAIRAPWDGGIVWKKDANGTPFISSSCQGIGASIWWPNKDHLYDEVASMTVSLTVPRGLVAVSNGKLTNTHTLNEDTVTYDWAVENPINNYGVHFSVGDYVSFSENYQGEKGILNCTYYVLKPNLEKAQKHFKDVFRMLKAFEYWFGPYPFYQDGYKLVESPFLGMEHQSAISYGNGYKMGYRGNDLSGTGWGLNFDFIIIHESAHEWFGNSITNQDRADMWIHESFASYAESLFLEYYYGKEAGFEYVKGTRMNVVNDRTSIGIYGVNHQGSGDMYFKGANMLHTLRQFVNDDKKWRQILRNLNSKFFHQTVTTQQVETYLSQSVGRNLTSVFNQYLRDVRIPTWEYRIENNKLWYRWGTCISGFDMPVKVFIGNKIKWLKPTEKWKCEVIPSEWVKIKIDNNFYINEKQIRN
ncbi:M1 family metallopeptidase [Flavobacterium sp. UMI-01]|uniref:M1 family metallopeptidase n=1 Tax=Flavobacterium sp. UMI-01 TaxID=1441053 RepID=UPI001C7DBFA6|nr:M1 family metallopeptidase [Flavobacterium sp. UMI-01]GIZ08217.1 peptidase M1 [Flavobacterium sp. UMI-01]